MENKYSNFLREIKNDEMRKWKSQKQSIALGLIEAFLGSEMEMAEVKLDLLPEPESKESSRMKSTRQDSFASSFYAWKKKKNTKERLNQLGFDLLLIRRGENLAIKKVKRG